MALARISFQLLRKQGRKRYPIVCRVSMGYSVAHEARRKYRPIQFYTGQSIAPNEWDATTQRASTRADKARGLKACIDHLYINSTLERVYDRCRIITEEIRGREFDGVTIPLEQAKELLASDVTLSRLRGVTTKQATTTGVLEWLSLKNEESATTTEGTKKSRRNTLKHLRAYHEATHPGRPLSWEALTREYLESFRGWLVTEAGLSTATTNKQLNTLRTFLEWGRDAGKITASVRLGKLKEEQDGGKMYLAPEAIDALCALDLKDGERDARDWFVIACGTGIRVSDLLALSRANLIATQGKAYAYEITHRQGKTKKVVSIPLVVPQAVQTLERLGWQFPQPRTQPYLNRTIKELARRAGLNAPTEELHPDGRPKMQHEAITMHTGRRSFATNAYIAGIPLDAIRAITGHSDIRTLEIYLRQTDEEKRKAFANTYTQQ